MELRQLKYFTRLYEDGSVARAAKPLDIVRSAISIQIEKLKEESVRQLFVRGSKGMMPTIAAHEAIGCFCR